MYQIVLFIHVIIDIALIVLILLQQGKGATIGAAFGSGASTTVFGSQGSGSFLLKLTGALGAGFFATCIMLAYIASHDAKVNKGFAIVAPVTQSPVVPATNDNPAPTTENSVTPASSDSATAPVTQNSVAPVATEGSKATPATQNPVAPAAESSAAAPKQVQGTKK